MNTNTPYNKLNEFLEKNKCKLITPFSSYENKFSEMEYMSYCGHTVKSNYKNIIKRKYFMCNDCKITTKKEKQKQQKQQSKIQLLKKQTNFKNTIIKFERKYIDTHKYRSDFTEENYNKTLRCWDCKREKYIRFFPYRKQYKDNKEKRCKNCNKENTARRRKNITKDQYIDRCIFTSKYSAISRKKKCREEASQHTIDKNTILSLLKKQNNKCALSGRELVFKINNPNRMSIDRIDSDKGYTEDNIQLVTWVCNQAKSNLTNLDFKQLIKDCYHHLHKK